MTGDVLRSEVHDGGVVLVTLHRPEVRNALNAALRRALSHTMATLDDDPEVSVIVLTGADPAFCAGLDLKELGAADGGLSDPTGPELGAADGGLSDPTGPALGAADGGLSDPTGPELGAADGGPGGGGRPFPELDTPVIGAVNGVAVTGGFELALACDFLVAGPHARFADTHARVGIQPGWGLTVALPQAVGLRRARELSFTGNYLDATTALTWGLVNHVVDDHDDLIPFTLELARDVADNDRAGVRRIRRTYRDGSLTTVAEALALEARVSAEWLEGVAGADVEARRRGVVERGRRQL